MGSALALYAMIAVPIVAAAGLMERRERRRERLAIPPRTPRRWSP